MSYGKLFLDKLEDERGSALILAVSLVVLLSILALGYGVFASTEFQMGINENSLWQATYLAEAGVNRVIYELREKDLVNCKYLRNIDANHYRFDDNPLTTNVFEKMTVKNEETAKTVGDVEIEVYKNQVDVTIISRGTHTLSNTKKTIKATVRNESVGSNLPFNNYKITSWQEY